MQGAGGGVSRTVSLGVVVSGDEPEPITDISGTEVIACYFVNNICDESLSKLVEIDQSGSNAPYTITGLGAVAYIVGARKDGNGDEDFTDAEDYLGFYMLNGQPAEVTPPATGIDLVMSPALVTQAQQRALQKFWESHR